MFQTAWILFGRWLLGWKHLTQTPSYLMQSPSFYADTSFMYHCSCKLSCRSSANVFILVSIALFDHDRQESVSPRWNLEQLTVAMTFFVGIVCQFGVPCLIVEEECWVCVCILVQCTMYVVFVCSFPCTCTTHSIQVCLSLYAWDQRVHKGEAQRVNIVTSRCSLDTIWRANWDIHNMEGRVIPSIYNTEGWAGARGKKIGGTLLTKERGKMSTLCWCFLSTWCLFREDE